MNVLTYLNRLGTDLITVPGMIAMNVLLILLIIIAAARQLNARIPKPQEIIKHYARKIKEH